MAKEDSSPHEIKFPQLDIIPVIPSLWVTIIITIDHSYLTHPFI